MAPPRWKVVLIFDEDLTFSSRSLNSETCPCKYCWCDEGTSKWLHKLDISTFLNYFHQEPPVKPVEPPLWKLVLNFTDGSEFSSRPMNSDSCACQYCWCGKHGNTKLLASDLYTVREFFSSEAVESLEQLFEGCSRSTVNPSCTSLVTTKPIESMANDANAEWKRPVTRALAKIHSQSFHLGTESEHPRASAVKPGTVNSKTTSLISEEPAPARRQSVRISQKKMSHNFVEYFDSDSDEDP